MLVVDKIEEVAKEMRYYNIEIYIFYVHEDT